MQPFDDSVQRYIEEWQQYQEQREPLDNLANGINCYRVSTALMKTCESKDIPGGLIASPSIPWGFTKGDNDLGGYHLVWTRDQAEGQGSPCCRRSRGAYQVLIYYSPREPDGHWPQNMWLEGRHTGQGFRWTRRRFPSCWQMRSAGLTVLARWMCGLPCARPQRTSYAMGRRS